jgi:glycine cleavage system H protein
MNNIPEELKYAVTHEWVLSELGTKIAIVGVTDYAQDQLGEIVYVELPEVGLSVSAGDEVCVLESVKTASDVFSPLTGKIVAVNEDLEEAPSLVNSHPYQDGWLYKIEIKDQQEYDELFDAGAYEEHLQELLEGE